MTRTTAKYIGLIALATILFYWKTLLTNQFTIIIGSEGVNQTYGWLHFWVNSVWRGHPPLWDPYGFGGRPFTEEMAGFYPLRLVFALLPFNRNGLLSPRLFHEYLAAMHFLGAVFMFALLRELRRSHFASFVGACAFAMGGIIVRMMWPQYVESCIWLPAVFFFLLRALRAESRKRAVAEAALSGLCIGLSILTGGIQFSMMQSIFVVAAAGYYGAVTETNTLPRSAQWLRLCLIGAVLFAVAGGIGSAQLLPSFEYGDHSVRSIGGGFFPMSEKIPYDRMDHGMWPESILSGLFPTASDARVGGGEIWPWYIGVLPLLFAVTAIWKCWHNLWVRFLAVVAALAFAYSLGEFSPLHGIFYALVPYLWMARQPSRFLYLVSFAMAALAAFGLDSLLDNVGAGLADRFAPAKPFLKWTAIICSLAVILPGVFTQISLSIWTCLSLLLILASCGWFYRLMLRPASPLLRFMLAAFILMDLASFNWLEANKSALVKSGVNQYEQMITLRNAAAFVRTRPGPNRVRVIVQPEPNIGDIYGVQDAWGDGAALLTDYGQLLPREDLLNVRYRIKPASTPDPGAIYQDALWKVYEDPTAYPRAWLVHQTITEPSHDAVFRRIDQRGLDLHNVALVETPLPLPLDQASGSDSVRFRSYEADQMAMDVNAAGSGLLVLSEIYYPGWKATVNGQTAEIRKVDGGLRGIVVPRGPSHVVLEYVPFSFYAGIGLSLLTGTFVVLAWFYSLRSAPQREAVIADPAR